eukprot:Polyplicarium_translucidae@DN2689_c0_g1_i2.p1
MKLVEARKRFGDNTSGWFYSQSLYRAYQGYEDALQRLRRVLGTRLSENVMAVYVVLRRAEDAQFLVSRLSGFRRLTAPRFFARKPRARVAPAPEELLWENVGCPRRMRYIRSFLLGIAVFAVVLFFGFLLGLIRTALLPATEGTPDEGSIWQVIGLNDQRAQNWTICDMSVLLDRHCDTGIEPHMETPTTHVFEPVVVDGLWTMESAADYGTVPCHSNSSRYRATVSGDVGLSTRFPNPIDIIHAGCVALRQSVQPESRLEHFTVRVCDGFPKSKRPEQKHYACTSIATFRLDTTSDEVQMFELESLLQRRGNNCAVTNVDTFSPEDMIHFLEEGTPYNRAWYRDCWCRRYVNHGGENPMESRCRHFNQQQMLWLYGFIAIFTVMALPFDALLLRFVWSLLGVLCHATVTDRRKGQLRAVFGVRLVTLSGVLLLTGTRIFGDSSARSLATLSDARARAYSQMGAGWYADVGTDLALALPLLVLCFIILDAIRWVVKICRRRWFHQRQKIQMDLNCLFADDLFSLEETLGHSAASIVAAFVYSAGMPLTLCLGAVSMLAYYCWSKARFLWGSDADSRERCGATLAIDACKLVAIGIALKCVITLGVYGHTLVLPAKTFGDADAFKDVPPIEVPRSYEFDESDAPLFSPMYSALI